MKKEEKLEPIIFQDKPLTQEFAEMVIEKWKSNKFLLLTPPPGVGKTFISIHAVGLLPGGHNAHFVIFGPKAKKLDRSWEKSILGYNIAKNTEMTYTVNTQNFLKDHFDKVIEDIQTHVDNGQPIVVLVDEVHLMKNPTSKAGKALKKLIDIPMVDASLGISATPYSNSYIDVIGYLVINNYYRNKTDFMQRQVKFFNEYRQPVVKDQDGNIDRNLFAEPDLIDQYLSEMSISKEIKKLPLPPCSFQEHSFDLNNDKSIKYIHPLFEEIASMTKVAPRTQLGNYNAVANKYYREGYYESSTEAIAVQRKMITNIKQRSDIVTNILSKIWKSKDPHPVLIFYETNLELDTLKNILTNNKKLGPVQINIVNGKRKDLEDVKDPNTVVLIQYKAGGAAIEFKHAYSTIYFMPTYANETYQQTLGRNRRNGMTHHITYHKIIANNTLDDYMWHTIIENKQTFSESVRQSILKNQ